MAFAGFSGGAPRAHPPANVIHPELIGLGISGLEGGTVVDSCTAMTGVDPMCQNYVNHNLKLWRIPVTPSRLTNNVLGGPLYTAAGSTVADLHNKMRQAALVGAKVVIDVHAGFRWDGNPLPSPYTSNVFNAPGGPPAGIYADLMQKISTEFKGVPGNGGIEITNEPWNMALNTDAPTIYQLSINAIREVDTDIDIYIDGDGYATVWGWTGDCHAPGSTLFPNPAHFCGGEPLNGWATGGTGAWMLTLNDPSHKLHPIGHLYGDYNASGFYISKDYDFVACGPAGDQSCRAYYNCQSLDSFACFINMGDQLYNPAIAGTNHTGLDRLTHSFVSWCDTYQNTGSLSNCIVGESGWPHDNVNWINEMDQVIAMTQAHGIGFWYWNIGPDSRGYAPSGYGIEPDIGSYTKPNNGIEMAVLDKYTNAPSPTYYFLEQASTHGTANVASDPFTVDYRGYLRTTVRFTPSDNGANGTFTPAYIDCPPGFNCALSFTYTPPGTDVYTISITNNGGLTDPANLVFSTEPDAFTSSGIDYSMASTAMGMVRLVGSYQGPALAAYRDDGVTMDFGFVTRHAFASVDQAAIAAWAGTHAIKTLNFYDQTGHASAGTVNDGSLAGPSSADYPPLVLNDKNGLAAMNAAGTSRMSVGVGSNGIAQQSVFTVSQNTSEYGPAMLDYVFCCGQSSLFYQGNPSAAGGLFQYWSVMAGTTDQAGNDISSRNVTSNEYIVPGLWMASGQTWNNQGTADAYINGSHVSTNAFFPRSGLSGFNFPWRGYMSMFFQPFVSSPYNGKVGAIIVLNGQATPTQSQSLTQVLANTWALPAWPRTPSNLYAPTLTRNTNGEPNPMPWKGVNEAGMENGSPIPPAAPQTDNGVALAAVANEWCQVLGADFIRLQISLDHLFPNGAGGAMDTTYLSYIDMEVAGWTTAGCDILLDNHSHPFGSFGGITLGASGSITATQYGNMWAQLNSHLATKPGYKKIQYDWNNEPGGVSATDIVTYDQAAINAVRASEATQSIVYNHYWHFESPSFQCYQITTYAGPQFLELTDTVSDKGILQCHAYNDDNSGRYYNANLGVGTGRSVSAASTAYLVAHNIKAFIGETGQSFDPSMTYENHQMFKAMMAAESTWVGATFWGGGDFGDDYQYPMDQNNNRADVPRWEDYPANAYFTDHEWGTKAGDVVTHFPNCYGTGIACDEVFP